MNLNFDISILITGIVIFFARIVDVSLGTLRTISIIQGRTWVSFWLGFGEIIIWLWVISTVVPHIREIPMLAIFYAFGFASGNMVGIRLDKVAGIRPYHHPDHQQRTFQGNGGYGPQSRICRNHIPG